MRKYEVTVWPAQVARQLKALCEAEAISLHQTAAFRPRAQDALTHTANILMLQVKAHVVGLLASEELYIDVHTTFLTSGTHTIELISKQPWMRNIALVPPYTVPSFLYKNQHVPADEIPHILSYKCLDQDESFDMYKRVVFERSIRDAV